MMWLSAAHTLSAYDASYLTLAIATDARLATLDASLPAAAVHHGVSYND
jgi:predicted nucleic acid-binding protein